jgi:hypothetical protein
MRPEVASLTADGFTSGFAAALVDPTRPTPPGVIGPSGKSATRRYNVYRNNVTVSLVEALAAVYPAIRKLTGDDFFRAMARDYVRSQPPTSKLLFDYGRDFPTFIDGFAHVAEFPWLGDVARIERAWLDAYHAADVMPAAPDLLASIDPERLAQIMIEPHPATRVLRSPYPVVSIFAMNRSDGPAEPFTSDASEDALVTRPHLDVEVRLLPPGHAVFLAALIDGGTLEAAVSIASDQEPSFDLASAIAGMFEAGVVTGLRS